MDIFAVVVFIILGAALVAYVASPTTARGMDTFGAGFVPYRSAGWPQGVQEEEPVHWSWSAAPKPEATDRDSDTSPNPQLVEIAGPDAPVASDVHRGQIIHDRSGRRDV